MSESSIDNEEESPGAGAGTVEGNKLSNFKRDSEKFNEYLAQDIDHTSQHITVELRELYGQGKYDEAIKLGEGRLDDFSGIDGSKGDDIYLRHAVARCYHAKALKLDDTHRPEIKAGLLNKAVKHLEAGLRIDENDSHCLQSLGQVYADSGNYSKALEVFSKLMESNENEAAHGLVGIAKTQRRQGDMAGAQATMEELLEKVAKMPEGIQRDGKMSIGLSLKARSQLRQNNIVGAQETAEELIKRSETMVDEEQRRRSLNSGLTLKAQAQLAQRDGAGALATLNKRKKLIETMPDIPQRITATKTGLMLQIQAQWAQSDHTGAAKTARALVDLVEKMPEGPQRDHAKAFGLGLWATSLLKAHKVNDARAIIGVLNAIETDSAHVQVLNTRADMVAGNYEEAMNSALRLSNEQPFNPSQMFLLRIAAYKAGRNNDYAGYLKRQQDEGHIKFEDNSFDPIKKLTKQQEADLLNDMDTGRLGEYARSDIFNTNQIPEAVDATAARVATNKGSIRSKADRRRGGGDNDRETVRSGK